MALKGSRGLRVRVKTAKSRTPASARWLDRQLNDPFVAAARAEGWRSRAAFKLIGLDDRFKLIPRGGRIVDLGAAPGGWTQVAVQRAGAGARIVGIDLLPVEPIAGATFLEGDFLAEDASVRIEAELGGRADLVLSDMAPNTTGHSATDHIRGMALTEAAAEFAIAVLAPGGAFAAKVFQGGAERGLLDQLKRRFRQVRHAKPEASRKESREMYLVAQGFRPAGTER